VAMTVETKIINYDPSLNIVNIEQLPRGRGARYLEVLVDHDRGVLVAKQWRRNPTSGTLVDFKPVENIHQIYEKALEVADEASRKFSAIQSDYRSRKISDDAFLKGKAAHDRAQEVFDAAEAAYIKAKAEAGPIETKSHIETMPTVAGGWVTLAGGGRSFSPAGGMVIDGKPYSLKGESRLESSALVQASRLEGTIFDDVRVIYALDSGFYYVYAASTGKPAPAEAETARLTVVDYDKQYSLSELKSKARAAGVGTGGDKKALCRKLMDAGVL